MTFYKLYVLLITLSFSNAALVKNGFSCPEVNPMLPFNTTEYNRHTWYIQQQQITSYQPRNALYCVAQTLNQSKRRVPFYSGRVIDVYNYGTLDGVNGTLENQNNFTLCARQTNQSDPARITNGPCFLPNIFGGPYWVIGAGPYTYNYSWAIVSGGPPTVMYPDGRCSTSLTGVNGSGLWLFTRMRYGDYANRLVKSMRTYLLELGYSVSNLLNVTQKGCNYTGAYLK